MSTCEQTMSRCLLFCAALGALLSSASPSHAAPQYPVYVSDALMMPCVPACTICHQDLVGGSGTVVKPFGRAMQAAGLDGFNGLTSGEVPIALMKLEADKTDSNGDGIPDTTQLSAGEDPNTGAAFCGANAPLTPRYGCGAHIANVPPAGDHSAPIAALLGAAVLGASAHRTARRRRRAEALRHNR
jgi:hypothetical protein